MQTTPITDSTNGQAMPTSSPFAKIMEMGHENIFFCYDPDTQLKAIIGVHNTVLGPALGGLRFWNYENDQAALTDVLRLSRGMTFKSASAGINLGGGKAVIIGDPKRLKSEALLRRFGKFVDNLGGKYITAEDVGVNVRDMEWIHYETEHVTGLPKNLGGSGDPSPVTAYGVYLGMKAAAKEAWGSESLKDKTVFVHGVGKVGTYLCERLHAEGAKILVYDIYEPAVKNAVKEFNATAVAEADVFSVACDVYAPCALGGGLNPDTIPTIKAQIIAGGANNQLLDEQRDGLALQERNILYAPDFLINAGGVINVYTELEGYNQERALEKAEQLYDNTLAVFKTAAEEKITPHEAAMRNALRRIEAIAKISKGR